MMSPPQATPAGPTPPKQPLRLQRLDAARDESEGAPERGVLPDDIDRVVGELVLKAFADALGDADARPPFREGFPAVAEALKRLTDERFGGHAQPAELSVEYVSPGAFVYDMGRVAVANALQAEAFSATAPRERAVFLPHCLQNRKRCEASEFERYDRCERCGACAIGNIVELAESAGYLAERIFIVGGASVIAPIAAECSPSAMVGVACMEEFGAMIEKRLTGGENAPPSRATLLRRWGCRNTRVRLADVEDALFRRDRPGEPAAHVSSLL